SIMGGYDEALFLDKQGHVVEGSAENLFLVSKNTVYTPPIFDDILQGITRDTVSTLLEKELGISVHEQSMRRTQLYQADEIFLVGTGAEVLPVTYVDGRKVGSGDIGPISKKIKTLYQQVVRGENPTYSSWLTSLSFKRK
ncbi:MAG TPA: aminotransferase class IV, partial [Candidatus Eisenbacteria bacterium]|nr:aminotransferase class IV [Candidatus Eisenbacteria bacterium]